MDFDSYGPFELKLPLQANSQWRDDFWHAVDGKFEWSSQDPKHSLRRAIGCYAFLTRWGDRLTPWYVGKTAAKTGFAGEIFTPHKVDILRRIQSNSSNALAVALFPLVDEAYDFRHPYASARSTVEWVERILIGMMLSQNPEAANAKDTKNHREVTVLNIFGQRGRGRPQHTTQMLRRAFVGD